MIGRSIRARLTAWYVGALSVAMLTLVAAGWWLSTESIVRAADVGLRARVNGVRDFLENPRTILTLESLRDEFDEYAELTRGEALLEVIDGSGTVLCQPSVPGWTAMADQVHARASGTSQPIDRMLVGLPFRVASGDLVARGGTYRVTVAAPMGPSYAALNRFHRGLLLLVPLVIALAGVGGYWISRRALAPVDQITRAVRAITLRHLDRRLELPGADDELRRLASTFNDVLARLESAVGDIVRFTADASHELRTPVAIVRTTAELALRYERTPQEYRAALVEIAGLTRHMSELVEDLLILARTDAGIGPPESILLDLRDVASDASREIAELAAGQSVHVALHMPAEPTMVQGDAVSLRRLLLILLDNAVKYSSPWGRITLDLAIRTTQAGARLAVIEVSDDGIGLDGADAERAFERFYRGARARQHAPDGTGLGLPIARTIVDRLGGTIQLTALQSGQWTSGCRATVVLPLGQATSPDHVVIEAPAAAGALRDLTHQRTRVSPEEHSYDGLG